MAFFAGVFFVFMAVPFFGKRNKGYLIVNHRFDADARPFPGIAPRPDRLRSQLALIETGSLRIGLFKFENLFIDKSRQSGLMDMITVTLVSTLFRSVR